MLYTILTALKCCLCGRRRHCHCMPAFSLLSHFPFILTLTISLIAIVHGVGAEALPAVYWNRSNPIFQTNDANHVIRVNLNDRLQLICPRYDVRTPQKHWEYYMVFMVTKDEYDSCTIFNRTKAHLIINCSRPTDSVRYTLLIYEFQPVPRNPDFTSGEKYYFLSTSSGYVTGMENQVGGACVGRGMKMVLSVCCGDDDPDPASKKTTPATVRPRTQSPRPQPSITPDRHRTTTLNPAQTRPTRATTTKKSILPDFYNPDYNGPDGPFPAEIQDKMPELLRGAEKNSFVISSAWRLTTTLSYHYHYITLLLGMSLILLITFVEGYR